MANVNAGVFDPGAQASAGNETFSEADFTLRYGLALRESLQARGVEVFMTRTSSSEDDPLNTRVSRAKAAGCTHFVSVHLNAFDDPSAKGVEVLYRDSAKDKPLAEQLQSQLVAVTGFQNRGVQVRPDLAVLKFADGPAVLMELGFITNTNDRNFLSSGANRRAICEAVASVLAPGVVPQSLVEAAHPSVSSAATANAITRTLVGDGTWYFTALVEGDDIVVRGQTATWFGGDDDPGDNGETASGVVTRGNPSILGCALPMRGFNSAKTNGSPIPRLPWNTQVRVFCHQTSQVITVPLIDLGPAKSTGHALDLTQAAFKALGVSKEAGVMTADFRIIDGAKLASLT